METQTPRLYLLDGMAIAYRAYYAFITNPLRTSKGENVSAIYGFANTLFKILDDDKPEYFAVVFDTKEPTFRHKMYKEYKATRQEIPEELIPQLGLLRDLVRAFNIPFLELDGYEADDIMGTLARKAEKEKILTMLVTSDKDFMQLISPFIKMLKPGNAYSEWELVDNAQVFQKFGVPPSQVIDVLGLIGDKVDNVPGIPGVGEKTAIPLVQQFGSIENILANIDKIEKSGVKKKFEEHRELALLSKELVTIDVNVPIGVNIHELKAKEKDVEQLMKLFTRFEFRNFLKKIEKKEVSSQKSVDTQEPIAKSQEQDEDISFDVSKFETTTNITTDVHKYHLITTEKDFLKLCEKLSKAKKFVFDTETTSENALEAEVVGVSFCMKEREAYYVAVDFISTKKEEAIEVIGDLFSSQNKSQTPNPKSQTSNLKPFQTEITLDVLKKRLKPIFINEKIFKIAQNVKYDAMVLENYGIETCGEIFDTMIAHFVLKNNARHGLDAMAIEFLNYKMISFDDLLGTGKDRKKIWEIPLDTICEYSCEDADITMRLYNVLKEKLEKEKNNNTVIPSAVERSGTKSRNLLSVCTEVDFPLVFVLSDMERTGQKLDTKFLIDFSKELERNLQNLEQEIYKFADGKFNINSPKQLQDILFVKLGLKSSRKTKTGFSTDVAVLEELRNEHPLIEKLLEHRTLYKLKSTYVDALPNIINPKTGRVHTSYNQVVAATGRLSSSEPNLQNIPIRTELGRSIRKAFITEDGWKILSADYSQIELRIMAHMSSDEGLQTAFRNGEDIHASTAEKLFSGMSMEKREMRRRAKEINFGIMYGMGPFGLSQSLQIPQSESKEIIAKYFERFPKVKQFLEDTKEFCRRNGYVETMLGRRRYLPEINSKNGSARSNAERQAINAPIQGTAADMIKLAMIKIHNAIANEELGIKNTELKMLLQVHDELVFEVAEKKEVKAKKMILDCMKNALPLSVPIEVEVGVGENWLDAH
ncbi:MAG: DNA polymerase I [Ignavibacteriales bacterium]|nr:DNA polymerase I [Ignavibacteriales bacterium]